MDKINLHDKIFSRENIYAAIYALDSYINEPNLLSESDFELFCELKDKYNKNKILEAIERCEEKLNWVYKENNLFHSNVYFKLKGYKKNSFTFRPIHTCDLITQICIVSMLQPIMFLDDVTRSYSELSKEMPENFYGNKPSLDVEHLYQRWQKAYKNYSDAIIDKTREYYRNNKFTQELNLDLKDFFPSVDPIIIISYLKKKCCNIYEDIEFLEKTLVKLLYFQLNPENLRGWENIYYPNTDKVLLNDVCTTRGIPQGLPQAPFFGNIIMTCIATVLNKKAQGDALYYVDDSVIFTNISNKEFSDIVSTDINEAVCIKCGLSETPDERNNQRLRILNQLGNRKRIFQEKINYQISFHDKEKSFIRPIAESYAANGKLSFLRRQVSMGASIYRDTDEEEDISSLQKVTHIVNIIERIIDNEKQKIKASTEACEILTRSSEANDEPNQTITSKLKLLRRHLRFFKFRVLVLKYREKGELSKKDINEFKERFFERSLNSEEEIAQYMENFEEDIFLSEYRFILHYLITSDDDLQDFISNIDSFESRIAPVAANTDFLYFSCDAKGCKRHPAFIDCSYESLYAITYKHFGMINQTFQRHKNDLLLKAIRSVSSYTGEAAKPCSFIPDYASFVSRNAKQYKRMICNALCSYIFNVDMSDRLMLSKRSAQQFSYNEFRILAYIRNKSCNINDFNSFITKLLGDRNTIQDGIPVDMALASVLDIFIKHVSTPEHVDNLIQTHRIVASLWKNGSKFLNDYTLHNEDHAICLIKQCVHLCKTIDYFNVKHQDFYPLFLACYLHDISMVRHPDIYDFTQMIPETSELLTKYKIECSDHINNGIVTHHDMLKAFLLVFGYFEKAVRDTHARDSAKYVQNHAELVFDYIDRAILEITAEIGAAHGAAGESIYNEKSNAHNSLYSKKYLKILLRLADLMDMCCDRISLYRLRDMLGTMSPISQFHWISHMLTKNAEISARYQYTEPSGESDNYIIHETLQVNIYLHSLQAINYRNPGICKDCHLAPIESSEIIGRSTSQKVQGMKISPDIHNELKSDCPLACAWHMKKNKWLFDELVLLVKYLNATNSRLFRTNFEINYICINDQQTTSFDMTTDSTLERIMDNIP